MKTNTKTKTEVDDDFSQEDLNRLVQEDSDQRNPDEENYNDDN